MSERLFHVITGLVLLAGLYFDLTLVVYGLIAWLFFETATGLRLTTLTSRFLHNLPGGNGGAAPAGYGCYYRFNFDAERALRLVLALLLTLSCLLFAKQLWVVSWFIGFALVAAGLSGICPMLMTLRKMGFR